MIKILIIFSRLESIDAKGDDKVAQVTKNRNLIEQAAN